MAKLVQFYLLLGVACITAGAFGAIHNQISYSVSPEYFYEFKFQQFGVPERLHGRIGAAIVGWQASWWMGFPIGIPVLLIGLILPGWRAYFRGCLVAFGIVIGTALMVGLVSLAAGGFAITEADLHHYRCPDQVVDKLAFVRAGTMHNFSYLGGLLGIFVASAYLVWKRVRMGSLD